MSQDRLVDQEAVSHAADVLLASGHFLSALELYRESGTHTAITPTPSSAPGGHGAAAVQEQAAADVDSGDDELNDAVSVSAVPDALCSLFDAYPPTSDRLRAAQESARARLRAQLRVRQQSAISSDRSAELRYELRTAREDAHTFSVRLREAESQLDTARARLAATVSSSHSRSPSLGQRSTDEAVEYGSGSLGGDGESAAADGKESSALGRCLFWIHLLRVRLWRVHVRFV
jgi:hypothetical protein